MILTCPECATRFKIADNAIGVNGRTVRCSQCSATWFAAAEPDILNLEDAKENTELRQEATYKENTREPVSGFGAIAAKDTAKDTANENIANSVDVEKSVDTKLDDGLAIPEPVIGAHAGIRENSDRKKRRKRLLGVGFIWLIPLVILALFALLAYLFRAQIVGKYPGTAPIYRGLGLQADSSGLEIYELKTRFETNEGVQAILVNGKIKNFDRKPRDVNMIRLSFKNAAGEVIDEWVVEPPKSVLKPGETLSFSSQFPNPPIDGVNLAHSFVTE